MFKKIILLVLTIVVTACANVQQLMKDSIRAPEVVYKNISIGQLTTDKIELKPTFNITNKNSYSIPIDNLKYELSFNQKTMIKGETDKVGNLPGNRSKDVTLAIGLTKDSLLAVKKILLEKSKIDYVIRGEVEAMGFKFPFEKSSVLYKPMVSLGRLEIKKANFKQVEIRVNLQVINNNDFILPLGRLNYTVSAGTKQLVVGNLKDQKIKQGVNQIQIPLTVHLSTLFSSMFSLMQNPKLPLTFNISAGGFETSTEQTLDLKSLFGG